MLSIFLLAIDEPDEKQKFCEIYEKYYQKLFNLALTITENHHSAEDALQNAFLGISRNMKIVMSLNDELLKIYVIKAVKNASINQLKSDRKNQLLRTGNYDIPSSENLENEFINNDAYTKTVDFIMSLDPLYKDVAFFHFILHMTSKEISNLLGRKYSTIRQQLSRVKKMIQKHFKELKK